MQATAATMLAIQLIYSVECDDGQSHEQSICLNKRGVGLQTQNCHVREASLTDVPLIKRWLRNPHDCKMAIGHTPVNEDGITEWLRAEDQVCWILESAAGPVGYGEIWVDEDARDLELAHFIVSPDHRN